MTEATERTSTAPTGYFVAVTTSVANTAVLALPDLKKRKAATDPNLKVAKAVYAHIQAMRALGHTAINTVTIARAIGVPVAAVEASLGLLKKKGVKIAR